MPKKTTIKTEEVIQDQTAAQPETTIEQPGPLTQQELELAEFFESVGPSANKVKIYKLNLKGEQAYCGTTEPGAVNEDYLLAMWGPGKYYLHVRSPQGYLGNKTIAIYGDERPVNALNVTGNPARNVQESLGNTEISLLREQINRQHEMLLRLLESQRNEPANTPSITELITAVQTMQTMGPKQPDPAGLITTILDSFSKGIELGRESGGGDDSKMSWIKLISDKLPVILGGLGSMIPAAAFNKLNGGDGHVPVIPDSAPASQIPANNPAALAFLKNGLHYLKGKALNGKPVDTYINMIADNLDDDEWRGLANSLMQRPFEEIAKLDPDIMVEPCRSWFAELYEGIKDVLSNTEPIDGAHGNDSDASGNEAPNDSSNT